MRPVKQLCLCKDVLVIVCLSQDFQAGSIGANCAKCVRWSLERPVLLVWVVRTCRGVQLSLCI